MNFVGDCNVARFSTFYKIWVENQWFLLRQDFYGFMKNIQIAIYFEWFTMISIIKWVRLKISLWKIVW